MKEGIQSLTTRRDSRSSSTHVSGINTPDYFVTTMQLRDRVLTARSQGQKTSRKTVRNMRSAPPFQNRNLDNYPMPYKREDAVRSAHGHRTDKRDSNNRMVKARADSGLMKEYSKQMFDFSVKTVNTSNGFRNVSEKKTNRVPTRTKAEQDYLASIRTNGPTPDGSILHNRKQKMLNSIRIRPPVEYEEKFHHERTCSRSSLQHTISDKNRRYRVRSVAESIRPVSVVGNASIASSDFIFEPVDQSSDMNGLHYVDRCWPRRSTIDSDLPEYDETDSIEGVFGKDPFEDIDDSHSLTSGEFKHANNKKRPYVPSLLPPDISCNIRLVSLDEPSSSESEEEKDEPVVEVKKPEPPPPPAKPPAKGKKNSKITFVIEEEKSKIPEPEPEPEPVKVKLILKGPHCWVDDATVTSESSEDEKGDNPDGNINIETQHPQTNGIIERLNNTQKTDNSSKTKSLMKNAVANNAKSPLSATLKQPNQQAMKDAFDKALQTVQTKPSGTMNNTINNDVSVVNTQNIDKAEVDNKKTEDSCEDKTEQIIKLPSFICPSSEKKSREAALKEWLAHTCFRSGHRGVPIV